MKKKIPIGVSDFKEVINENYYYVDKSLFIKEIVEDGSKVILIPRPRRFGKTLNMSILKYFYEKSDEDNRHLFKDLNISNYKEIMDMQGKYPVIYITFKDEKYLSWDDCKKSLVNLIKDEFRKHKYILKSDVLDEDEKNEFSSILKGEADYVVSLKGLKILSEYLCRYHKQKTVILIDKYDVPIQSGYLNNYYDKIIDFMRVFLSSGLKDNEYVEKSVLTGILRIAKESIFSGLNNLEVCTILKSRFSDKFGFLQEEVEDILKYYDIEFELDEVQKWYNGYIFVDNVIYNPWSILNYVKNWGDGFKAYWVNTSSNDLVKNVLKNGDETIKKELEALINGEEILKRVNEDIVMHEINKGSQNIWSFLLFSGYLKVVDKQLKEAVIYCKLKIPNLEVRYLYREIILKWFEESINNDKFELMLKSLTTGDIKTFGKILKAIVISSVSYFDVSGEESEKVYHAFVLGMLVALSQTHEVKSNRESGYGRYDVIIIPKNTSNLGIVIEFKKVDKDEDEDLQIACERAIDQIKQKKYRQELSDSGIENIIELGIAFVGKDVLVKRNEE